MVQWLIETSPVQNWLILAAAQWFAFTNLITLWALKQVTGMGGDFLKCLDAMRSVEDDE